MLESILALIFLSLCIGTGVWLFFLATVKRGDFDDIEGAKYRMLDDEDEDQTPPEDQSKNTP
jgi:cbb3-type cytochrome oxidase maturation protein